MFFLLCVLLGLPRADSGDTYRLRGQATEQTTRAVLDGVRVTVLDAATRDTLLTDVYTDANGDYTATFDIDVGTALEGRLGLLSGYWVSEAYPNPAVAGGRLTIRFAAPGNRLMQPRLDLFDALGRKVNPANALAGGVYFFRVRFEGGGFTETKTLVLSQGGLLDISLEQVAVEAARAGAYAGKQSAVEVLFVLEKAGYDVLETTRSLEPQVENTNDFALLFTGASLTPEQRMAALDDVEAFARSLPGTDFDAETQALVAFLQSRAEFTAAGASDDGTIWASFADGKLVFIVHSAPAEEGSGKTTDYPSVVSNPLRLVPPASERTASTSSAGVGTVPASPRFRLLSGVGSLFEGDPRGAIQGMLTQKGYVGTSEAATLDVLRSVSGDGIFYFRSHGGPAFRQIGLDEDFYAIWTATPALDPEDEQNNPLLMDDLNHRRVGYMLFRNSRWTQALPSIPEDRHYGITHRFVDHYMSFSQNSLVYLDACNGASWPFVREAFMKKGASVFVGWNERALFSAIGRTAQFVFDRLLGANVFNPENPPQRPFNYAALPDDPKFGSGKTYGYSVGTDRAGGPILATLAFYPLKDDFGILAPSIKQMEVDEIKQELTVHGLFGMDPGSSQRKVTVGGAQANVKQWNEDELKVDLPPSLAGDVIVTMRDHESNPAPLTEWNGVMRYTVDVSAPSSLPANTLQQKVTCSLVHIRADVHDYREKPGMAPLSHPAPIPFIAAQDVACNWAFTGSGTNADGVTSTLSGSGPLPWQNPDLGMMPPTILIMGEIDVTAKQLRFTSTARPGFFSLAEGMITITGEGGTVTVPMVLVWHYFTMDPTITLGQNFQIPAGSTSEMTPSAPPLPVKLEWEAASAGYAPNDNTPARYEEGPLELRPEATPAPSPRRRD